MTTKELPKGTFSAAAVARELGIDPRFARARLRKLADKLPPVVKDNKAHVHNEAWVFENKYRDRVIKAMKPQGATKDSKVKAEADKAAKDLAKDTNDADE